MSYTELGNLPSNTFSAAADKATRHYNEYMEGPLSVDKFPPSGPWPWRNIDPWARKGLAVVGAGVETFLHPESSAPINKPDVFDMDRKSKQPAAKKQPARGKGRGGRGRRGRSVRSRTTRNINGRTYTSPLLNTARKQLTRYPAISYATNRKSGPQVKFLPGRIPGSMRMKMHFRVGQIVVRSPNTATVPIFSNMGTDGDNSDFIIPLNPSMGFYFPTYVTQLALVFQKFYMNFAAISICPRVSTTNQAVVTLGYTPEITWPENTGQISGGFTQLTETAISSLPSSCTEILYRDCTVVALNMDKRKLYYMATPQGPGQIALDYNNNEAAELRQCFAGAFVVSGIRNGTDAVGTIYADVYMDMDVDFIEFNTVIAAPDTLRLKRNKRPEEKTKSGDESPLEVLV